jgi:hypothetical protein
MSNATSFMQDLSNWTGQPFWTGWPAEGRVAYIVYTDERFVATGKLEGTSQVIFAVRGLVEEHLNRFKTQMWQEGARIVESRGPLTTDPIDKSPGTAGHEDETRYSARD